MILRLLVEIRADVCICVSDLANPSVVANLSVAFVARCLGFPMDTVEVHGFCHTSGMRARKLAGIISNALLIDYIDKSYFNLLPL